MTVPRLARAVVRIARVTPAGFAGQWRCAAGAGGLQWHHFEIRATLSEPSIGAAWVSASGARLPWHLASDPPSRDKRRSHEFLGLDDPMRRAGRQEGDDQ
jgi:hypothetical protein